MVTILSSCPQCGRVELEPAELTLVVFDLKERSHYRFHCEGCDQDVVKPADEQVVALLAQGGVLPEMRSFPQEALEEHEGAPVSIDEVLEFILALRDTDELAGKILR